MFCKSNGVLLLVEIIAIILVEFSHGQNTNWTLLDSSTPGKLDASTRPIQDIVTTWYPSVSETIALSETKETTSMSDKHSLLSFSTKITSCCPTKDDYSSTSYSAGTIDATESYQATIISNSNIENSASTDVAFISLSSVHSQQTTIVVSGSFETQHSSSTQHLAATGTTGETTMLWPSSTLPVSSGEDAEISRRRTNSGTGGQIATIFTIQLDSTVARDSTRASDELAAATTTDVIAATHGSALLSTVADESWFSSAVEVVGTTSEHLVTSSTTCVPGKDASPTGDCLSESLSSIVNRGISGISSSATPERESTFAATESLTSTDFSVVRTTDLSASDTEVPIFSTGVSVAELSSFTSELLATATVSLKGADLSMTVTDSFTATTGSLAGADSSITTIDSFIATSGSLVGADLSVTAVTSLLLLPPALTSVIGSLTGTDSSIISTTNSDGASTEPNIASTDLSVIATASLTGIDRSSSAFHSSFIPTDSPITSTDTSIASTISLAASDSSVVGTYSSYLITDLSFSTTQAAVTGEVGSSSISEQISVHPSTMPSSAATFAVTTAFILTMSASVTSQVSSSSSSTANIMSSSGATILTSEPSSTINVLPTITSITSQLSSTSNIPASTTSSITTQLSPTISSMLPISSTISTTELPSTSQMLPTSLASTVIEATPSLSSSIFRMTLVTSPSSPSSAAISMLTAITPSSSIPSGSAVSSSSSVIPAVTEPTKIYGIMFTVKEWQYTDDLADKASSNYSSLKKNVLSMLTDVYNTTDGYMGVELLGFQKGSVIVDAELTYNESTAETADSLFQELTNSPVVNTLGISLVNITAQEKCSPSTCNQHGLCTPTQSGPTCNCDRGSNGTRCQNIFDIDGNYTAWSVYTRCDKECGTGKRVRTRQCTNPAPANNGLKCSRFGVAEERQECNKHVCNEVIVGIIAASVALIILAALLIACCFCKRPKFYDSYRFDHRTPRYRMDEEAHTRYQRDIIQPRMRDVPLQIIEKDPRNGKINEEFKDDEAEDDDDIYKKQLKLFLKQTQEMRGINTNGNGENKRKRSAPKPPPPVRGKVNQGEEGHELHWQQDDHDN